MNRTFAAFALAGLAASLGACVYYPHGAYGPGYGPPPPAYGEPPQGTEYGPPPGQQPPPGYEGQQGPPPQGSYGPQGAYGPPQGEGPPEGADGPPQGAYGPQGPTQAQIQKMNDPNWCAAHPRRCERLRSEYGGGQPQGGPPPGQQ